MFFLDKADPNVINLCTYKIPIKYKNTNSINNVLNLFQCDILYNKAYISSF